MKKSLEESSREELLKKINDVGEFLLKTTNNYEVGIMKALMDPLLEIDWETRDFMILLELSKARVSYIILQLLDYDINNEQIVKWHEREETYRKRLKG